MKLLRYIAFPLLGLFAMSSHAGNEALIESAANQAAELARQIRNRVGLKAGENGIQVTTAQFKIDSHGRLTIVNAEGKFVESVDFTRLPRDAGGIVDAPIDLSSRKFSFGVVVRGSGAPLQKLKDYYVNNEESISVMSIDYNPTSSVSPKAMPRKHRSGGAYLLHW